jgi:predicted O-methyltransferase YrrM
MKHIQDPNELMKLPRAIRAFRWRLPLELTQLAAKITYKPFGECLDSKAVKCLIRERGREFEDTSVTTGQRMVLLEAVKQTEQINLPIVEVGAWRGATTVALAAATRRTIFAVDPFDSYPGAESDMQIMLNRTRSINRVKHVRLRSGKAAEALAGERFSLIFIDAIHDYINTWFDFLVWERLLAPGGIIAFHDVDDHVGTNLACRRVLRQKNYKVWGYCPNLVAFEKVQSV